ncbi:hypothetical protein FACS1894156_8940 [Bacteroidia bacterium]|nr:hypothetical protein FACS1894156_8940 [Bacteroidia bacterium]
MGLSNLSVKTLPGFTTTDLPVVNDDDMATTIATVITTLNNDITLSAISVPNADANTNLKNDFILNLFLIKKKENTQRYKDNHILR